MRTMSSVVLILILAFGGGSAIAADKPDVSQIYGKIQLVDSFPDYKVKVVDSFVMEHPKTRQALAHLAALGVNRALVIDIDNETLKLSIRNVPTSKFLMTGGLNVRDLVHYDHVVITEAAVREIDGALKR